MGKSGEFEPQAPKTFKIQIQPGKKKSTTPPRTFNPPPMFIGEYHHSVDEKGRMAVPAKFRDRLSKGAVVTKGLDGCLVIYPQAEWEKLAEKLASLPISQSNTRAFSRLMLAGAMDIELDKQGRMVVPEYLREYASLSKKVVVAGLFNRLEVWSEDAWTKYRQQTEEASNEIAEQLGVLGV